MHTTSEYEERFQAFVFAKFFRAYAKCSEEIQSAVRDMIAIVLSVESDDDEREMALATVAEALFPQPSGEDLGLELKESEAMGAEYSEETRAVLEEMDVEESSFASALRRRMEERGLSQSELASKAGVGQPAISMMLKRQCRPQMRTVERLAEALGVQPEELWPIGSRRG